MLDTLVEKSRELDLLSDVSKFSKLSIEAMKMSKERNFFLAYHGRHMESDFYGNIHALMKYAGIPLKEKKYFPIVSHEGCILKCEIEFKYKSAVIIPGQYYREKIHRRAPYVPVFTTGPYIHYAESIYSRSQIEDVKKKNGRTLLIFLPHSIENIERKYRKIDFINSVFREYKSQFQSIWLCNYWVDINDPVCEYAESMGIHVVTAGFRFDPLFDCRLKSILEIADAVLCGDIGTFISYALYMGKPIGRLDISNNSTIPDLSLHLNMKKKLQINKEYRDYQKGFTNFFDTQLRNSEEQKKWMDPVSGFEQVRDKEYINHVFSISKDIWLQCEGDLFRYPEAVRKVYSLYEEQAEIYKMAILKSAVGAYID
ncbi:MAG: hypothetical protein HFH88_06695 [Lachnospiraceae bacterium]|nr:hypothetical protein [Lachnospiraceae bacterium]